jgi:hypothetical protein
MNEYKIPRWALKLKFEETYQTTQNKIVQQILEDIRKRGKSLQEIEKARLWDPIPHMNKTGTMRRPKVIHKQTLKGYATTKFTI